MQETRVRFQGREDPLEKELATQSSILAWRIPMHRGAWRATIHGVTRARHSLAPKPPPPPRIKDTHVKTVSKAILRSGSGQTLIKCVLILLATTKEQQVTPNKQ